MLCEDCVISQVTSSFLRITCSAEERRGKGACFACRKMSHSSLFPEQHVPCDVPEKMSNLPHK